MTKQERLGMTNEERLGMSQGYRGAHTGGEPDRSEVGTRRCSAEAIGAKAGCKARANH
jgi:hypothetical protein